MQNICGILGPIGLPELLILGGILVVGAVVLKVISPGGLSQQLGMTAPSS
jgi:hypothetical protein